MKKHLIQRTLMLTAGAGLVLGLHYLHAQEATSIQSEDAGRLSAFQVELRALEQTTPTPASEIPTFSTNGFYSAQNPDWPPLPADIYGVPAWNLDGTYVLDDLNLNYAALASASRIGSPGGVHAMDDDDVPPSPGGGGGTNDDEGEGSYSFISYTTNQLWLQITGVTNNAAYLIIHPPWNVTNGVYDLYYTTNLVSPVSWQWVMRSNPGQTNLIVPNATDAQGFYRLGPPNDLAANDSLGTNFWLAFPYMTSDGNPSLSLIISSPAATTGTVNFPGFIINGPTLTISGCGDTNARGTYVLTNLTTQEYEDFSNAYLHSTSGYEYGTNWVVSPDGSGWYLVGYNSSASNVSYLYETVDDDLDGAVWGSVEGSNPPPTNSSCPQVALSLPFSLAAGTATNMDITNAMNSYYTDIETNSIHIIATAPVSVYGFDYDPQASAAFTAYPVPLLGTNYCVMSRESSINEYNSEIVIVATEDGTTVTVTPSANADFLSWPGSDPGTTNLQQGETIELRNGALTDDATGTWIQSDKPIAVFAGTDLAYVPDASTASGNPLVQEQMPVEDWGTQVLGLSFAGRLHGDTYRVLTAVSNIVTITMTNGTIITNLAAGTFYEKTNIDGPVEFQASQPIQVAQFANGANFDHSTEPFEGDPCEILLLPIGHYLATNTVFTLDNTNEDFNENYLNVIAAQSAITNTFVDGSHIASTNFAAIGTSGYYGAQLTITNSGTHTVTSSQPVGVEVYGFGEYDAYGYFGGVVK